MAQTIKQKLIKLAASMENHVKRGNRESGKKSFELIIKYDDLRRKALDEVTDSGETVETVWANYCREKDWCYTHTGIDFFA